MNTLPKLAGMVVLAIMLAACHRGSDITFDGHSVSLHAGGHPTATITSNGSFSVGAKAVDLTPPQRQLFLRYYNRVTAIHAGTQALKQAGWHMAGQALDMAGHSIKEAVGLAKGASTSDKAVGQAMQAKGEAMAKRATELCHSVDQAKALQATISQDVSAFTPYAAINPAPGVSCNGDITVG